MKTLKMKALVLFAFLITATSVFAGGEKTEVRNVKGFKAIKVSAGIDLYLRMGDVEKVSVVADEDVIDKIKTEVDNGVLKIYMKQNNNWFSRDYRKTRKAYVTVTELEAISASSGSDVKSEGSLSGEQMDVKVSSGADVDLEVIYKNLTIDTSSGSDAKLRGKVKNLQAEASSGSDIKASDLKAVNCEARASSGSNISVYVSGELKARASSGADISYYGNPEYKDTNESSGGDIKQR